MGLGVFFLCSLAFHAGELVAFRAADEPALVAGCTNGDELAALGNVAVDRIFALKLLPDLIKAINYLVLKARSHCVHVDSVLVAATWGPVESTRESVTDILV